MLIVTGLLWGQPGWAQVAPAAPHGYDFLTFAVQESPVKQEPHIQFAPAFQRQTVILLPLSDIYASSPKALAKAGERLTIVNQQLSAIIVAGWELFQLGTVSSLSGRITIH